MTTTTLILVGGPADGKVIGGVSTLPCGYVVPCLHDDRYTITDEYYEFTAEVRNGAQVYQYAGSQNKHSLMAGAKARQSPDERWA